ncbi:MAG: SUF system Fe-S cluster assembly regulator [bacterium]
MLRLTKLTDYGIVLMTHLAQDRQTSLHNARDLAAEAQISLPMVNKILKHLATGGLLASHRGVKGGYTLARPAERISVAQIVQALEGPVAITECSLPSGDPAEHSCEREDICRVRTHTQRINQVIWEALGNVPLSELVTPPKPDFFSLGSQSLPSRIAATPAVKEQVTR